jgi:drug/metabolite transporter (DMT)-like permease
MFKRLMIRVVSSTLLTFLILFVVSKLPLSTIYIAVNTSPVIIYFLGFIFLGNKILKRDLMGIALAFLGLSFIIN